MPRKPMSPEAKNAAIKRLADARAAKKAKAVAAPVTDSATDDGKLKIVPSAYEFPARMPPAPRGLMPSPAERDIMVEVEAMLRSTGMMPAELDTPQKALVIMFKGWELGLSPLRSVEGLYLKVEEGRTRILQRADLMRELVQRSGRGIIVPVETTDQQATVRATLYGIRGREDAVHDVTFTLDMARQQGLLNQEMWRTNPRACLFATASSTAVRQFFADVLHGVIYTPEELGVTHVGSGAKVETAVATAQVPTDKAQESREPQAVGGEAGSPDNSAPTHTAPSPAAPKAAPAANPDAPPADRPFTLAFKMADKDGKAKTIETSGITRLTLVEIMKRSGDPAVARLVRGAIEKLGVTRLRFLTEPEGVALIQALNEKASPAQPEPAGKPANGGQPPQAQPSVAVSPEAAIARLAQEIEMEPRDLGAFIASTHQVESLAQLPAADLERTLREMRALALADKDALRLMVGRSQAEAV